jgi:hypothetical protein
MVSAGTVNVAMTPRTAAPWEVAGLRQERVCLGVDNVNHRIGTIGEIILMRPLIDPANVEGVQTAGRIGRVHYGDRNRSEQPDGPSIRFSLVSVPRSCSTRYQGLAAGPRQPQPQKPMLQVEMLRGGYAALEATPAASHRMRRPHLERD